MTDLAEPGTAPAEPEADDVAPRGAEAVLAHLRHRPPISYIFRGFGPLVVAAVLLVLMIILAPSVAPEQEVEQLINEAETEVTDP